MKKNEDTLLSASSKTDEDFGLVSTYLGVFPPEYTKVIDFQLNSNVIDPYRHLQPSHPFSLCN